jgi:hypothetical protein
MMKETLVKIVMVMARYSVRIVGAMVIENVLTVMEMVEWNVTTVMAMDRILVLNVTGNYGKYTII